MKKYKIISYEYPLKWKWIQYNDYISSTFDLHWFVREWMFIEETKGLPFRMIEKVIQTKY